MFKTIFPALEKKLSNLTSKPVRLRAILSVLLVIPLFIFAVISYLYTNRVLTDAIIAERHDITQLSADIIKERLDKVVGLASSLASRPSVVDAVSQGRWDDASNALRTIPAEFPFVQALTLYDTKSILKTGIPSGTSPVGRDFSFRDWYKGVSHSWSPYVSEVYHSITKPELNIIGVVVPIRHRVLEEQSTSDRAVVPSEIAGILNLHIRVEVLGTWAQDISRLSNNATIIILDKNGNLVFHQKYDAQGLIRKYPNTGILGQLLERKHGVMVFQEPGESQRILCAFYPVPQYDFSVVMEEPERSAFKERDRQLMLLLLIYLAFFVLASWVVYSTVSNIVLRKAIDDVAKESERRYQGLFDSMRDGVIRVSMDWKIQEVNASFAEIVGYTKAELLQMTFMDLTADAWKESTRKIIQEQTIGRGYSDEYEKEYIRKDGIIVPISAKSWLIRDEYGKGVGMWGFVRDISERKRMEKELQEYRIGLENLVNERTKELRQSEEKYRRLIETANEAIWQMDKDFVTTFVNLHMEKLTGYTAHEMVGHPTYEFIFPEDRDDHEKRLQNRRDGFSEHYERRLRHKDGHEVWTIVSSTPLYGLNSEFNGAFAFFTDITERKRLEESRTNLSKVVESSLNEIYFFDPRTLKFQFVNLGALKNLGYTLEEMKEMTVIDVKPEFTMESYHAMVDPLIKHQQEGVEFRSVQRRKDGSIYPVEVHLHLGSTLSGTVFMAIILDISERIKAEEEIMKLNQELEARVEQRTTQLAEANKELEAFSYSVSHDLRAPLRSMDGFSQAVLEDYKDKLDAQGKDYLLRIRNATQRMAGLIDDLLDLSRVGRAVMHLQEIDLAILAKQIIEELHVVEPDRNIDINIGQNLIVHADEHLMRVLLDNLLRNAWKFTSKIDHAHIWLDQTTIDGNRVFFVRDNGAGFDMNYADKLFTAFSRLHSEKEFPGSGIGLALVRRIMNRHQGTVWAEGVPGRGATVYFRLP